ncbi:class I SAM-dependent methyltransferase [Brachyspira pilosicoli]|uniref:O-methyltransferase n=1 Tax=Brachyspira pilosicoli TaxID=52584 RepID=UPI0030071F48
MFIENIENFDSWKLDKISDIINQTTLTEIFGEFKISEMSMKQQKFLNGLIRYIKPKKILEVGVAAGASSAIILNAIEDIEGSKLYSVDYSKQYYKSPSKKTGWVVDEHFQCLSNKWDLNTGGPLAKFIENIGNDIDICLLDTMHMNPGEILDLLVVLPFMKKNGIIILHDTCFHTYVEKIYEHKHYYTNGLIFSVLKGEKYMLPEHAIKNVGNIGAVKLSDDVMNYIFDYFYLLTLPWSYMPNDEDFVFLKNIYSKYYDEELVDFFNGVVRFKKLNNSHIIIDNLVNNGKIFNKIVKDITWWIPIKKLRYNVRNKLLYGLEFNDDVSKMQKQLNRLIKS